MFHAYCLLSSIIFPIILANSDVGLLEDDPSEPSLLFAVVLFRHGARTPIMEIPFDNKTQWIDGPGEISDKGRNESYALGIHLRDLYVGNPPKLIQPNFNLSQLYCRSTSFNRNLITIQLVLAAMFPPVKKQEYCPDLNWQPIPIHSNQPQYDDLLLGFNISSCTRLIEMWNEMHSSEQYESLKLKYSEFLANLSKAVGIELNLHSGANLYDSLVTEQYYGFEIPEFFDNVTLSTLKEIFYDYWGFHINVNNSEYKRISSGVLWSLILEKITGNIGYLKNPKEEFDYYFTRLILLSAQDTTLLYFMNLLGLKPDSWPIFNSHLRIEIFEKSDLAYMKIIFSNGDKDTVLKLPYCPEGDMCRLDTVIEKVGNLRSSDRQEECRSNAPPVTTTTTTSTTTSTSSSTTTTTTPIPPSTTTTPPPTPAPTPTPIPGISKSQSMWMWGFILVNSFLILFIGGYILKIRISRRRSIGYTSLE